MCAFQTMFGIVLIANSLNSVWEIRFKIYPFEDTVNISTPIHWIYINTYKTRKKMQLFPPVRYSDSISSDEG